MKGDILTMFLRLLVLCLLLTVSGCGEEPATSVPKSTSKKVRPAPDKVDKVESKKEEPVDDFIYSPIGQRDPFESLLLKEKKARKAGEPKTPLEKFDLGQFRIQAILIGKGVPRAMVSAPDGKNYILKPGLKIGKNSGVIKDITKTSIVIEESSLGPDGSLLRGLQSIAITEEKPF